MLQLRSLVKASGELELSLASVPLPDLKDDEILVRIEAAPINPSDLGLLLGFEHEMIILAGPADISQAKSTGAGVDVKTTAPIPQQAMRALGGRVDESMPIGNEGAGTVIKAGSSTEAQALMGKTVAVWGGATYSEFKAVKASDALPLHEGTTAAEGAASFINPLTALCMLETMRREGHSAVVHTAAASNLGQMLVKLCKKDNVPIVNVVRNQDQVAILKSIGAVHILDSTQATFLDDLVNACEATGATLAFDAIGGGKLASQILWAMEQALNKKAKTYNRYGSSTHKQVYIYGALDTGPTDLARNYGLGGWLLSPMLMKFGKDVVQQMRHRVVLDIKTTFESKYEAVLSLLEVVQVANIAVYSKKTTGKKFLINPSKK